MSQLSESQESDVVEMLKEYLPDASLELLGKKLVDVGLSSMDFITLVFDVEDKYSVDIDTSEIDMDLTLREFLTGLIPSGGE